jgi:serine/threonine-protein kinase
LATSPPGQRLGRYHLIEPLGGGPCGEVYRAKVVGVAGMDRHFAVKRLHQTMVAAPGVSAKLSQVCRAYAGLDHPRIARLSELGVGNGETFTVTDLVAGIDLARLQTAVGQSGTRITAGAALGLVSAAARAVGYAHGRGVCHWGLAPTNLLATADGDVRVTDFGVLACRLGPRPVEDASLHARLAYLAPEQLIGEPVSPATDVYCLGVLAYELLAAARP